MTNPTRTGKAARWIERSLALAGMVAVGIWACSVMRTAVFQSRASRMFDRTIENQAVTATPVPMHQGELVGRLVIPHLHLRAMVREGSGEDTLDLALGHIPGTAFPGQRGNVGIAGHRDTLFRGLRKIAKDDRILFQTLSGSYLYQVETTAIVRPQDVAVLDAGDTPEMTLVTCYPFRYVGPAPRRFVVKARLVCPPGATPASPVSRPEALTRQLP